MTIYGIPYMGSKSEIASSICAMLPKGTHFYDLFGGGFSMTHCMMQRFPHKYSHFHYNEIQSDVVGLVQKAINGEFNYNRFNPEWISKQDFFARKKNDAYIRCLWSFGNNQRGYLFGENIEYYKRSMHQAVIFNEFDELAEKLLGFTRWPSIAKSITQKRLYLKQKIDNCRNSQSYAFLPKHDSIGGLPQLQQLERLQGLEKLKGLNRLAFYSNSYEEIEIFPNSIVYCDIPYLSAYKSDDAQLYNKKSIFARSNFLDWAASRSFPVFVSEYEIKDGRFRQVYAIDKASKMKNILANKTIKNERLYWNGVTASLLS